VSRVVQAVHAARVRDEREALSAAMSGVRTIASGSSSSPGWNRAGSTIEASSRSKLPASRSCVMLCSV